VTIASGTKLGRDDIRRELDAGAMGEVYLAQDTKLGRRVALKILPREFAAEDLVRCVSLPKIRRN
jgi:serine/threonine protein kinase